MATEVTSSNIRPASAWCYLSTVTGIALAVAWVISLGDWRAEPRARAGVQTSAVVAVADVATEPVLVAYLVGSEVQRAEIDYREYFTNISGFSPTNQQVKVILADSLVEDGEIITALIQQGQAVKLIDLRGR